MTKKKSDSSSADLTAAELRFIDEYLIDRSPHDAALRAGVAKINVKRTAAKWMGDPRIARAIQFGTDNADLDAMISPQRILAGFIEVAFDRNAPSASRNSALKELAAIKKMYGEADRDSHRAGVLLVPGVMALDDWNAAAMTMQKNLKDEVKK